MNGSELTMLRDKIEEMDHLHQLGILEIIKKGNIDYTENSNGVFINMSILNNDTVSDIKEYIKYIKLQIMNAMVSPKKNALEIFGFNGSMKTEQNSKDDKKDLKAKGYAFIRYKMIEDKE